MNWIKHNKVLFAIILIVILIIIIYLINSSYNKKQGIQPKVQSWPLKLGSSGAEVLNLQKYLNWKNNCGLKEDGQYGLETQNCVQDIYGVTEVDQTSYNQFDNELNQYLASNILANASMSINDTLSALGWKVV